MFGGAVIEKQSKYELGATVRFAKTVLIFSLAVFISSE